MRDSTFWTIMLVIMIILFAVCILNSIKERKGSIGVHEVLLITWIIGIII